MKNIPRNFGMSLMNILSGMFSVPFHEPVGMKTTGKAAKGAGVVCDGL